MQIAAEPVVKDVYHFHGLERLDLPGEDQAALAVTP